MMNLGVVVVLLGLVAYGSCFPGKHNISLPLCDSPEAEAAAQAALDFINAQHTHGYKYTLNEIEDIKVFNKADGTHTYLLELELLETKCHVSHPKPVPECKVRPKVETAVEADCDVALSDAGGQLSVAAFKCKTELETFSPCPGCIFLQALNDTDGTQLVQDSLALFNNNNTFDATFDVLDVGRLTSQIVGGGPLIRAEYAIIETNCTNGEVPACVPMDHGVARQGFCQSEGHGLNVNINCEVFQPNANGPSVPSAGPVSPSITQGFNHHKLPALHDPEATGLLSAESNSAEKAPIVKRTVAEPQVNGLVAEPVVLRPRCPGKTKHF
ncbi:alpha-2-HS-glycoprotein 2 [Clarias gariepinus]|uniref:alpha-2-HS-glycoprotein 2 n=1 Tax=Clarias gariepinus TaxID=13013 RepID=UPI00234E1FB8|nr:alpha-2-HS-glycoprotein 2 [Clarias gariepinus]